jgi:hypothetical protein
LQRNYEIEQIKKTNHSHSQNQGWLEPQETSIKSEKASKTHFPEKEKEKEKEKKINYSMLEEMISKKKVSWGENQTQEIIEYNETEENIFNKLKRVNHSMNLANIDMESNEAKKSKEDRLDELEKKMEIVNDKVEKILDILNNKK